MTSAPIEADLFHFLDSPYCDHPTRGICALTERSAGNLGKILLDPQTTLLNEQIKEALIFFSRDRYI